MSKSIFEVVEMEAKRFAKTGEQSFFGEYLYDRVVPAGHFLRELLLLVDWDKFSARLFKLYKGRRGSGAAAF